MASKDAQLASLFVGLPPGGLTKQEQATFSSCIRPYLAARDHILKEWHACPTSKLDFATCEKTFLPKDSTQQLFRTFCFLEENGYINTGFLKASEADEGPGVPEAVRKLLEGKGRSPEVVQAQTFTQLLAADMTVSPAPKRPPHGGTRAQLVRMLCLCQLRCFGSPRLWPAGACLSSTVPVTYSSRPSPAVEPCFLVREVLASLTPCWTYSSLTDPLAARLMSAALALSPRNQCAARRFSSNSILSIQAAVVSVPFKHATHADNLTSPAVL